MICFLLCKIINSVFFSQKRYGLFLSSNCFCFTRFSYFNPFKGKGRIFSVLFEKPVSFLGKKHVFFQAKDEAPSNKSLVFVWQRTSVFFSSANNKIFASSYVKNQVIRLLCQTQKSFVFFHSYRVKKRLSRISLCGFLLNIYVNLFCAVQQKIFIMFCQGFTTFFLKKSSKTYYLVYYGSTKGNNHALLTPTGSACMKFLCYSCKAKFLQK